MDKYAAALVTALATTTAPDAGATKNADAQQPKTQFTVLQQTGGCEILGGIAPCDGNTLTIKAQTPRWVLGASKISETVQTENHGSQNISISHTNPYFHARAEGNLSANASAHFNIKGVKLFAQRHFTVGENLSAYAGIYAGQIHGYAAAKASANASLALEAHSHAKLQDLGQQYNFSVPQSLSYSNSISYSEFTEKSARSPYGGLTGGVAARKNVTPNTHIGLSAEAQIGPERVASTMCMGGSYSSSGTPSGRFGGLCNSYNMAAGQPGFFVSAAYERTKVIKDTLSVLLNDEANQLAARGNAALQNAALNAGYSGSAPHLSGRDILDGLGFGPYIGNRNSIVLQAGKTWDDFTLAASHKIPLGESAKHIKPTTNLSLSYSF